MSGLCSRRLFSAVISRQSVVHDHPHRRILSHCPLRLYSQTRGSDDGWTAWETLRRLRLLVLAPTTTINKDSSDRTGLIGGRGHLWKLAGALGLMLGGKCLAVQTPYIFKRLVETLSSSATGNASTLGIGDPMQIAGALLVGYAAARLGSSASLELKNVLVSRISHGTY